MRSFYRHRQIINIAKHRFSVISHIDVENNTPKMVDVSEKSPSPRIAHARAIVNLPLDISNYLVTSFGDVRDISAAKGPVFATAIVAGTMASKRTADLIPFCHQIPLDVCDIKITFHAKESCIEVNCITKTTHKTGVEMEALVGASHAALTIYDMLKALSPRIEIASIKLIEKTGGKSDFKCTNS